MYKKYLTRVIEILFKYGIVTEIKHAIYKTQQSNMFNPYCFTPQRKRNQILQTISKIIMKKISSDIPTKPLSKSCKKPR